ncbi:MAG TPA: translation elongation factor Ts [Myxococcota bacterium]|nr:translation elongation factor Ts [Myxococcota bacterium]
MAEISAGQVKELREQTGAGMMDCKKALAEASGDTARAIEILRERGIAKASKRVGRAGSEGRVIAAVGQGGRLGALVELNCETDFVAKTDDFTALGDQLAQTAIAHSIHSVDELLDRDKLRDKLTAAVAKLGEDLAVRRVARVEAPPQGFVSSYVHAGGKIGTLVAIESPSPAKPEVRAFAHNVCMHVAATSPASLSREDLPKAVVDDERRVLAAQAASEGKPPQIVERMIEGRLAKFFKEVVLLEQGLVMDPDKTVGKAAQEVGAKVLAFRRFQLGEAAEG